MIETALLCKVTQTTQNSRNLCLGSSEPVFPIAIGTVRKPNRVPS